MLNQTIKYLRNKETIRQQLKIEKLDFIVKVG